MVLPLRLQLMRSSRQVSQMPWRCLGVALLDCAGATPRAERDVRPARVRVAHAPVQLVFTAPEVHEESTVTALPPIPAWRSRRRPTATASPPYPCAVTLRQAGPFRRCPGAVEDGLVRPVCAQPDRKIPGRCRQPVDSLLFARRLRPEIDGQRFGSAPAHVASNGKMPSSPAVC